MEFKTRTHIIEVLPSEIRTTVLMPVSISRWHSIRPAESRNNVGHFAVIDSKSSHPCDIAA
jgi:hypothetical protein